MSYWVRIATEAAPLAERVAAYRAEGSPLGEVGDDGIFKQRRVAHWHRNMGPAHIWECCGGRGMIPCGSEEGLDVYCVCGAGQHRVRIEE